MSLSSVRKIPWLDAECSPLGSHWLLSIQLQFDDSCTRNTHFATASTVLTSQIGWPYLRTSYNWIFSSKGQRIWSLSLFRWPLWCEYEVMKIRISRARKTSTSWCCTFCIAWHERVLASVCCLKYHFYFSRQGIEICLLRRATEFSNIK